MIEVSSKGDASVVGGGAVKVQVVGINHVTAPVEVREQVALTSDAVSLAYQNLGVLAPEMGVVILATCNRTEIYVAGSLTFGDVLTWWERWSGVERRQFADHLYWYQDDEAVDHLFRVAAGLDSMIVGETEILGQVKAAYQLAQQAGAAGALHRLFQTALKVGKRARTETGISQNAISVGHVVVELAERVFGSLKGLKVLLLGAGEMAELAAKHLQAAGARELAVLNRTPERGRALAKRLGGEAYPLEEIDLLLGSADVVVAATKSRVPLITAESAREAFRDDEHRLRFFFDLSVPRNVDAGVARAGREVFVYDIDDVRAVVEKNQAERMREAQAVEHIVEEERLRLKESMGATEIAPVIRSLRDRAETIRSAEMSRALGKLNHLSNADRELIEQATRAMVNKILNDPMASLRRWAGAGDRERLDVVMELFDLRPDCRSNTLASAMEHRLGAPG